MTVFHKDSQNIYRVAALEELDWLVHGFGTRSSPGFAAGGRLATLHQIHSDIVVDAAGHAGCLGDGDALIENTPGVLIGVKTADCTPILMADPRHRAVAAVHAGWRGTAKKIAELAVAEMGRKFSTRAEDLVVAVGPAIGKCCYEVGPEVAGQFREYDPTLGALTHSSHLDLAEINRRQLVRQGVPPYRIYMAGLCTMCLDEFHSYRRDKHHAGRMLSAVGVR